MGRATVAALVLACGFGGCAPVAPEPAPEAPPPELTTEQARAALIELIRSPEPGELKDFPLERFVGDGVEGGAESPSWGPFSLHLKEREYTYSRAFGQPPRVCRWQYRGGSSCGRAGGWLCPRGWRARRWVPSSNAPPAAFQLSSMAMACSGYRLPAVILAAGVASTRPAP